MQCCLLCLKSVPKSLVILQWNCRSVRAQRDELLMLISDHNPHIIVLCETWLKEIQSFFIRNYKIVRKDRQDGYGGVLIACRNDVLANTLTINTPYECVGCAIELSSMVVISIVSVYFPHNTNVPFTKNNFELLLSQVPQPRFVLGDFNSHGQQWGGSVNDTRSRIIVDVCDDNNLVTLNTGLITRIACPPIQASVLDLSICSDNLALNCLWDTCDSPHGSDHIPITISYNISNAIPRNSNRPTNLIKNIRWEQYTEEIEKSELFGNNPSFENYDVFVSLIKETATNSQNVPPIVCNGVNRNFTQKVWWTNSIDILYNERLQAFRIFRRIGGQVEYLNYKKLDAKFRQAKSKIKKEKWQAYCSTLNKDTPLSSMFNMAKRYRGGGKNNSISNKNWISDFINKLAPPTTEIEFKSYTSIDPESENFFLVPFNYEELQMSLNKCNNSCPGLDNINFVLIKHLPENGKIFLLKLYNFFVDIAAFPKTWYDCKVVTIPKSGKDPNIASSYRPICLLSCIRKLFEKMFHTRLDYWIESNKNNSTTQFGFRKGFGTLDCLSILCTDIELCFAKKSMCLAVFLDVASAYDDVCIDILCDILHTLKFPRIVVKIVQLLFYTKNVYIFHNNIQSDLRVSFKGLAQGSTLSPLLYNVYTRNLESTITPNMNIIQYADDVVLYTTNTNHHILQANMQVSLNNICIEYKRLGLEIATNKSKFIVFSRKYKLPAFNLKINNIELNRTFSFRYLGITFDSKCLWKDHVEAISKKCVKRINFIRSVSGRSWGGHPLTMLTIYKSTIRPILEYGSYCFQNLANTHKLRIKRIQWRAIRVCFGLMTSTHTATLEVQAGVLPLDLRWKELALRFLCKSLNGPSNLLRNSINELLNERPDHPISNLYNTLAAFNTNQALMFSCYSSPWSCLLFSPTVSMAMKNHLRTIQNPTSNEVNEIFSTVMSALGQTKCIYTDGSKTPEGIGSAVFVSENMSISQQLQKPSSVFVAELTAVILATEIINNCLPGKFVIATDSMSVAQCIRNTNIETKTFNLVYSCKLNLLNLKCRGYEIIILWIPAHKGILGNERADEIAKQASVDGRLSECVPEWQNYIPEIAAIIKSEWQIRWTNGDMGRYFHSICPVVSKHSWLNVSVNLSRPLNRTINRLASNHYGLNHHLNRINIIDSPICSRCGAYETADHILFTCPHLINRNPLIQHLVHIKTPIPFEFRNIIATCNSVKTITLIYEFLLANNIEI